MSISSFNQDGCYDNYKFMGAHPCVQNGVDGWMFRVWAVDVHAVSVIGDFNGWRVGQTPMVRGKNDVWSCFVDNLHQYDTYKFAIITKSGLLIRKADPYAFHAETRPGDASKLYDLECYQWGDANWLDYRKRVANTVKPVNLYEIHLGSWRRTGDGQVLNYRETASYLVPYVKEMGYSGVKLLPMMEHPLDESFGYQSTGYFAVTSRFGTPSDFMYFVDKLHQAGISVAMDFVLSGFPTDSFGLEKFNGMFCYEKQPRIFKRLHKIAEEKKTLTLAAPSQAPEFRDIAEFDLSKREIENFLLSSVYFWIEKYHIDWLNFICPQNGGTRFLIKLNKSIHRDFPYVTTSASEGFKKCGFDYYWNNSWVDKMMTRLTDSENTNAVFAVAPRPDPNCVLPISHDYVQEPNLSLPSRMVGDDEMKFAHVRAFYLFVLTQPGGKLSMMGTEFGQWASWKYSQSLDWHLLQYDLYQKQQRFFKDINNLYLTVPSFWHGNTEAHFHKIKLGNIDQVVAYVCSSNSGESYYVVANFSLHNRDRCWIEIPCYGIYKVLFSTDDVIYGGYGRGSQGEIETTDRPNSDSYGIYVTVPPMSAIVLSCVKKMPKRNKTEKLLNKQKNKNFTTINS